jgi:hypothetical protein
MCAVLRRRLRDHRLRLPGRRRARHPARPPEPGPAAPRRWTATSCMSSGTTSGSSRRRPTASADQPAAGRGEPPADGVPSAWCSCGRARWRFPPRAAGARAVAVDRLGGAAGAQWALVAMFLADALDPGGLRAPEARATAPRRGDPARRAAGAGRAARAAGAAPDPPDHGTRGRRPGDVDQVTSARGPLGGLERHCHVVERAHRRCRTTRPLGGAGTVPLFRVLDVHYVETPLLSLVGTAGTRRAHGRPRSSRCSPAPTRPPTPRAC